MDTIGQMTMEQLKAFVDNAIEQRLGLFEILENEETDPRSLEEIFESIEQHRWTPPAGSPSPSEMIRQDRDNH